MNMFIVPITPLNLSTEIKPSVNINETENSGFQDIFKVMINAEKAAIALELTVQVTSKAISAYNEIMRMQF